MQMPQIRPRMASAGVAPALRIGRVVVLRVTRIPYVQTSLAGEELSIARVASGKHAVEHVDSSRNAFDEVLGSSRTHEISRLRHGQPPRRFSHDVVHEVDRFTHAQAPNRIALKPDS